MGASFSSSSLTRRERASKLGRFKWRSSTVSMPTTISFKSFDFGDKEASKRFDIFVFFVPSTACNTSKGVISFESRTKRYPPCGPRIDSIRPLSLSVFIACSKNRTDNPSFCAIAFTERGTDPSCRERVNTAKIPYLPFTDNLNLTTPIGIIGYYFIIVK